MQNRRKQLIACDIENLPFIHIEDPSRRRNRQNEPLITGNILIPGRRNYRRASFLRQQRFSRLVWHEVALIQAHTCPMPQPFDSESTTAATSACWQCRGTPWLHPPVPHLWQN